MDRSFRSCNGQVSMPRLDAAFYFSWRASHLMLDGGYVWDDPSLSV
jgi:hypothetical protein